MKIIKQDKSIEHKYIHYYLGENYIVIPAGFVNIYHFCRVSVRNNNKQDFTRIKMLYAKNLKSALLQSHKLIKELNKHK